MHTRLKQIIAICACLVVSNVCYVAYHMTDRHAHVVVEKSEVKHDTELARILETPERTSNTKSKEATDRERKLEELQEPRPNTCDNCFIHDYKYIVNSKNVCRQYVVNQTIHILFLIFVPGYQKENRDALRQTWLSVSKNNTSNVRYVFLIGSPAPRVKWFNMTAENEVYNDIVEEDFVDSYFNITYKLVQGLKWASIYCPESRFVFKTDSDIFINMPVLFKTLDKQDRFLQSGISGSCGGRSPVTREGVYATSVKEFPKDYYPPYCSGGGYFTSSRVVKEAYKVSKDVPFFKFEDVYMGLLLEKLGYRVRSTAGFNLSPQTLDACAFKSSTQMVVHGFEPEHLFAIWNFPCTRTNTNSKVL